MPMITQTLCDGCQAVKKETNHWYTLVVDEAAHHACLRPMAHTPASLMQLGASPNVLYFCGRLCAIEAIAQWMDRESGGAEAQPLPAPRCRSEKSSPSPAKRVIRRAVRLAYRTAMSRSVSDYCRVHYRVPIYYPAVMVYKGDCSCPIITNLSVGGCAAEDHHDAPVGSKTQLVLQGLSTSPVCILTAIVRWRQGHRCGLEFVDTPSPTYERLRRAVIDELARRYAEADS